MPPSYYQITRVVSPAISLALITLEQAKGILGIDGDAQDAALTQQIDQVSRAIDNYCNRIFMRQGYRDQFRYVCNWLNAGEPLRTRQPPIATDVDGTPVLTVTEDGVLVDPAGWETDIDSGEVYRIDGSPIIAPSAWRGALIVVDYDGGFDPIPADVQGAALEWLTARWMTQGRDPALRSETIPDVISQTWATADATMTSVPSGVRDLLAPYRLWSV